jgi:(p)ppGpp synthase/HD superfamily hydrolase
VSDPVRLFDEAIKLVAVSYSGKRRKVNGSPASLHSIGTAVILGRIGCSETLLAAGILHDIEEDTDIGAEELVRLFGPSVAKLVHALSNKNDIGTWLDRKKRALERLRVAPQEALLVKCADAIDNLSSIRFDKVRLGDDVWKKLGHSKEEMAWYFDEVANLCASRLLEEPAKYLVLELQREFRRAFGRKGRSSLFHKSGSSS